jgi:hypothetical protein
MSDPKPSLHAAEAELQSHSATLRRELGITDLVFAQILIIIKTQGAVACRSPHCRRMVGLADDFRNFPDCVAPWRAQGDCLIAGAMNNRTTSLPHPALVLSAPHPWRPKCVDGPAAIDLRCL